MVIKTITCHDVYNTGASLQAYALLKYLTDLGHDVTIIDYKPDYLSNHYSFRLVANQRYNKPGIKQLYLLAKFPSRLREKRGKRKKNFDEFTSNYLRLTRRYNSIDELEADPPQADVYFAGSDQIWNTNFNNGKDRAFYLSFASENAIKASYAASFATEDVDDNYKAQIKEWLTRFDYLSVRETTGLNILSRLGIKQGNVVVDPVFLLGKKYWEKLCQKKRPDSPYVFVYDFDGNSFIREKAMQLACKQSELKIVTMQNIGYGDLCYSDAGPLEFLNLIYNADYVLSNSFHATAFSIIFEKQFWVFNRAENINTRMKDLVEQLGIGSKLVIPGAEMDDSVILYDEVNPKLDDMIQQSKEYINEVLDSARRKQ